VSTPREVKMGNGAWEEVKLASEARPETRSETPPSAP